VGAATSADITAAGLILAVSGKSQVPLGEQVLQSLGLNAAQASFAYAVINGVTTAGAGLAADAGSAAARAGAVAAEDATLAAKTAAADATAAESTTISEATVTCSFAPNTLVLLGDGSHRAIGQLHIGDAVASRNAVTGIYSTRSITETHAHSHTDRVTVTVGSDRRADKAITTTLEHPFWVVGHGFTPARDLHVGDRVAAFAAQNPLLAVSSRFNDTSGALLVKALSIEASGVAPWTAYNLTVAEDHTYFVGESNVWVHNANCILDLGTTTAVSPTTSGRISATKFEANGYTVANLETAQQMAAADIAQLGDKLGTATEDLVNSVAKSENLKILDGGKYGSNNGFDHVFQNPDGTVTILLDSKPINASGATRLDPAAAGNQMQLSNAWVESVLSNLDKSSDAYLAVKTAYDNGTLIKGVVGVSKSTRDLVIVRIK